ncbi:MAG: DUF2264 domain-containing protein [Lachnospiraceae bacterium]|nr:DUF2264 domain-containing protein [Lachnospiraceae bacterium]
MLNSKKEWQDLLLSMSNPLIPYFSEGGARLDLGKTAVYYDQRAISMEGISRLFWGMVPYYAGGGTDPSWNLRLCKALASGTDPKNPEYWGDFTNKDQKFVEMAAIAYGILYAREKFWDVLSGKEQDNLAHYLYQINEYVLPECNWILFAVLVNLALKSVGKKYSGNRLEEYLTMTDSFYEGEGWYRDGDSNQKDYYISFAIHFYCLIYASLCEAEDPKRAALYKERAMIFAKQFIYWFDESGEALAFGRSLTYRFAQVAFFSACVIAGIEPFSLGQMKGLITRHMEQWLGKDLFDRDHILTIGYGYPNLIMAEAYNSPTSPYWAYKTFAILMLPDEHPFWSVEIEDFPQLTPIMPQPHADKLMVNDSHHATAYPIAVFSPAGHGQSIPKYGKFSYDTCFGFSVSKSSYNFFENAPDSMLAFIVDGDCHVRRIGLEGRIEEHSTYSKWSPYPGIMVETTIDVDLEGSTRRHVITSTISCKARDCGYTVACRDEDGMEKCVEGGSAFAKNRFSSCKVTSLQGEGVGMVEGVSPNTNILYRKTVLPLVEYEIHPGCQTIVTRVDATVVPGVPR